MYYAGYLDDESDRSCDFFPNYAYQLPIVIKDSQEFEQMFQPISCEGSAADLLNLLMDRHKVSKTTDSKSQKNPDGCQCVVCFEVKTDFPLKCGHKICRDCVGKTWTQSINAIKPPEQLRCSYGCRSELSEREICDIIPRRLYFRYQYFKKSKEYNEHKVFLCTNEDCNQPLIEISKQSKEKNITCPSCATKICTKCEGREHESKCTTKTKGKVRSFWWRFRHTQACPNCGFHMEKNGGCAHMDCPKCDLAFCWKCKGLVNHGGQKYKYSDYRLKVKRNCHCITGADSLSKEILTIIGIGCIIVVALPIIIIGVIIYVPYTIIKNCLKCCCC